MNKEISLMGKCFFLWATLLLMAPSSAQDGEIGFGCIQTQPFANAISTEETSCEGAYDLANTLLDDYKSERLKEMKLNLGVAFNNSLLEDVDNLAQNDFLFSYFNQDYGQQSSCSLESAVNDFPCLKESDANISELSNGKFKNVTDLFGSMAKRYQDKVSGTIGNSPNQCLNPFLRKKMIVDNFFIENKDFDLKKIALANSGEIGVEEKNVLDFIRKNLLGIDEESNVDDLVLSDLTGDTLKDRVASFLEKNKGALEKASVDRCNQMIKRVVGVACQPVTEHRVEDPDFNQSIFNYDSSLYEAGFDEFEAEFSDLGVESSYAHYVLNCQPSCEGECGDKIAIDDLQRDFFPKGIIADFFYEDRQEAFNKSNLDEEYCPLLVCANGLEVQKGGTCQTLEKARTVEEIRTYLNCEEDQYCQSEMFQSFSRVVETQQSSALSSFSQKFFGTTYSPDSAPVVAVAQTPSKELVARRPVAEVQERAESVVAQRERSTSSENKVQQGNVAISQSSQNALSNSLATPVSYTPQKLKVDDLKGENEYDRDLYRSMGELLRGAVDSQKKSNNIYNQNLEDVVKANRDLEKRIQQRLGESPIVPPRRRMDYPPEAQVTSPYRAQAAQQSGPNAWEQALADNRRLNSQWDNLKSNTNTSSDSQGGSYNAQAPSGKATAGTSSGGASASGAGVSGANAAPGDAGASSGESRVEGLGTVASVPFNLEGMKAVETNVDVLPQMNQNKLLEEGLNLNEPFLLRVKVEQRTVVVPVKPFLYKGKKMLAPVMDHENWILSDILKKSPLFSGYYKYEQERQAQLSQI